MKIFTRVDTDTTRNTFSIFIKEVKRDRKRAIVFTTLIPIGYFFYLVLIPLLMSFFIQELIVHPNSLEVPLLLIVGVVLASIATLLAHHWGYKALFNHEEQATSHLTDSVLVSLMQRSHMFFANTKSGALAGDLTGYTRAYNGILDAIALQLTAIFVSFISSLIIVLFIAPALVLPLLALTLFVVYDNFKSLQRRAKSRNRRKKLQSDLNGSIADLIGNQILVRVFGRLSHERNDIRKKRDEIEGVTKAEVEIIQFYASRRQAVLFAFQVAMLLLILWLFARNLVSIAALIFIVTYLGRVSASLFGINGAVRSIEQSFLDAAPLTKILSTPADVQDRPNAKKMQLDKPSIEFKDVHFRYESSDKTSVFTNLNLRIPDGQTVGLAGYSGGGKSTLLQLLLRFVDIDSGTVLVGSYNISNITQQSLREHISYVPQDPFLFHRSLRENIAYGNPHASDKEIMRAVNQANAAEFVAKMPRGLDTVVGERGVKLSGGQRQRIAIARAFLKNAPILLLDEATSALDSESEKLIQASLKELMKDRTSIVIAHRLSTIANLDRIIVLDDGEIAEDGTHDELLERNGTYAQLWSHQSGGFLED